MEEWRRPRSLHLCPAERGNRPTGDPRPRQVYQTFKDKALQSQSVLVVSGTSSIPGGLIGVLLFLPEDAGPGEEVTMEHFAVDHDFIDAIKTAIANPADSIRTE